MKSLRPLRNLALAASLIFTAASAAAAHARKAAADGNRLRATAISGATAPAIPRQAAMLCSKRC